MNSDGARLQTVAVGFANASMEIPLSYKRVPVEELENLLINSGIPEDLKQKLAFVNAFPAHFIIYSDTTNLQNMIWFQKGEHITLTKGLAQQYLSMLEQQLEGQWKPYGIDYDRVGSNFISENNIKILKLQYKLNHQGLVRYATQYLVSTKTQTIGVIVNGLTSNDFESSVRRLKIN
jgi:hypothetical protein